ncbi:MAG: VIT1/CCC1 transporter family protein [Janthinobacterium lividum]
MSVTQNQKPEIGDPRLLKALESNWQAEMEGSITYQTLADRENDTRRKHILEGLSKAELAHAHLWERRLTELGAPKPQYAGSPTGSVDTLVNRIGGPDATLRRVEMGERKHVASYGRQMQELGDAPSVEILQKVIADERAHSKALKNMMAPAPSADQPIGRMFSRPINPQQALDDLRARKGHRSPASWIGDAIYGVNDGLGAIFGIVSGVSGATDNQHYVLLAGLAGMIASALSMGSGAYLAAKSEREIYEAEMHRKRIELEENPEDGQEEMALVLQVKGLPEEDAKRAAEHLARDPEQFLKTLAAEQLNLTEDALSNPYVSAASGFISTAVGAFIPIIPFFFLHGPAAIIAAAVISLIAHFAVGAAKTMITVRSWWSSGLEMTAVGAVEGLVTYFIGKAIGGLGA